MAAVDPFITPDHVPAMQDNPNDLPSPAASALRARMHDDDDTTDYCRICRGQGSLDQPLFYPCKCSGSIRYVHQDCLMEWLAHSRKKYCELCKTPFRFTKLYDQSMPATLPLPLFLRQLLLHGLTTLVRWLRYAAVVTVWLIFLPWCIRQVWRGLFWLADGSWVTANSLVQDDAVHRTNASQATAAASANASAATANTNTTASSNGNHSTNLTVPASAPNSSVPSMLHSFLRLLTAETVVSKMLRLLLSVPPIQISSPSTAHGASGQSPGLAFTRPPSLLSDVKLINELTSSTEVNNFSLDVVEGLLICLALVTGFVLVFLIREWVINQQPIANIPDMDPAEVVPVAPAAPREGRPRPRRRRPRAEPGDQGRDDRGPPVDDQETVRVETATIAPGRAFSDDETTLARAQLPDRADLPPGSSSLDINNAASDADAYENREHFRFADPPPPLVRDALGDAVSVRRTMEEQVLEIMASLDQLDSRITAESASTTCSTTQGEAPGERPLDADQAISTKEGDLVDVSPLSPEPEASNATLADVADAANVADAVDEQDPSPAEAESPQPASEQSSSRHQQETADLDVQDQSLSEKLVNWFWHVEQDQDVSQSEQAVIGDANAQARFVPAAQNGGLVPPGAIAQAAAAPAVAGVGGRDAFQDHGPLQIEWADQNAPEDGEDLEGVFELMGMEGPLINMMQNVMFSLFLITLTMTASVWIPYVWGKLALILLAHPIITIRAPLLLLSTMADLVSDLALFIFGVCALLCSQITKLAQALVKPVSRPLSDALDAAALFEAVALNVTKHSGTRLENSIAGAASMATLGSDLPTFSIESHRSLLVIKALVAQTWMAILTTAQAIHQSVSRFSWSFEEQRKCIVLIGRVCYLTASALVTGAQKLLKVDSLDGLLKIPQSSGSWASGPVISADDLLAGWSTQDKLIAILLGYAFFGLVGFIFMKASRLLHGLNKDEKVPGALADSLGQASGVAKVILIIGIEMLVFPLYCGLLLDLALLPLFEGATVWSRLLFIQQAPFTGLFLHWFIGTCYMFHFALFVSMCRNMLRNGVLYFIRDPDDPSFHPVRDVLERPVATQLGKIAMSALVYGGLAIFCLGGVVWSINHIDGILPLRWSTAEPPLAFPIDLIFYNFLFPFIVRNFEPTKKLAALSKWWFRTCAHGLRLSHFLFGVEREDEKMADGHCRFPWSKMLGDDQPGSYARAPGHDSCRIPKGQNVFLPVSENNERLDGKPDQDRGLYGRNDERWVKVYLPPKFQTRLATFVFLLWLFAAGTGVSLTIGPLVVGRILIKLASRSARPVNDLYALTVGVHLFAVVLLAACHAGQIRQAVGDRVHQYFPNPIKTLSSLYSALKFILSHVYMVVAFGIVLPMALSLITELYIHVPLFTFVLRLESSRRGGSPGTRSAGSGSSALSPAMPATMSPTLFVLQTWTLGLLYMRIALRVALTYPSPQSQLSLAIRSIWRRGWLRPDVKQATRAVIIPLTAICLIMLAAPLGYARLLIALLAVKHSETEMRVYRYAYPGLMAIVLATWGVMALRKKIELWRIKIRDEMYLVGERLHNYIEEGKDKGKEKEKAVSVQ